MASGWRVIWRKHYCIQLEGNDKQIVVVVTEE